MRYHIVSIAAVFLALALGLVLGATKISSPLLSGLRDDNNQLAGQQEQLSASNEDLTQRITADEKFAGAVSQLAVRGTLPDTDVVLFVTADADPADRDAVLSLLSRAGATVTAQVQLTDDLADPLRADELANLAAQSLPAGGTLPEVPGVGATIGGLLRALLVEGADGSSGAKPEEREAALAALTTAGFLAVTGKVEPGRSVVILAGSDASTASGDDRADTLAALATELKKSATGVVVAGRSGSEGATGVVGAVRDDTAASAAVSTVDSVETASGRVATVLGLVEQNGGGVGRYGLGDNAQAQVPTLAVG